MNSQSLNANKRRREKMASTKKSKEEAKKMKQSSKESAKSLNKKTSTKSKTKATSNGKKRELAVSVVSPSSSDSRDLILLNDEDETKSGGGKNRRPSGKKSSSNGSINGKLKTNVIEENDLVGGEEEDDGTTCRFPMARIKRIIHSEDPNSKLSQDAVFLVNKATEKFIEQFCEEAYKCSVHDRKKSLGYKHLAMVAGKRRRFDFLSDYVPEKLKAADALAVRKLAETGQG